MLFVLSFKYSLSGELVKICAYLIYLVMSWDSKYCCFFLNTGFILTSVQLMLDAVLFALTLSTVQFFLGPSYHGVFFGPSSPNMLVTGIQLTLVAMILKVFMGIR